MAIIKPDPMDIRTAAWTLHTLDSKPGEFASPIDMREKIRAIEKLPPLPEIAHRILKLKEDPLANAAKLAKIVELDPTLAAQVIRWARSALFNYRGKVDSVKDAITRVLGFEVVFHLAFALASLKPLQVPREGPLGRRFFWRQTLTGSALLQKLALKMAPENRFESGQLHLIYLLHNIGHLLLAHLFRAEFDFLVRLIEKNPDMPILQLERFALGIDHAQLGAWLMQSWNMPQSIQTVVLHHHKPAYEGPHETLVRLTCLTDRLLGNIGIGDAAHTPADEIRLHEKLGLTEDILNDSMEALSHQLDAIDVTVASLVSAPPKA